MKIDLDVGDTPPLKYQCDFEYKSSCMLQCMLYLVAHVNWNGELHYLFFQCFSPHAPLTAALNSPSQSNDIPVANDSGSVSLPTLLVFQPPSTHLHTSQ